MTTVLLTKDEAFIDCEVVYDGDIRGEGRKHFLMPFLPQAMVFSVGGRDLMSKFEDASQKISRLSQIEEFFTDIENNDKPFYQSCLDNSSGLLIVIGNYAYEYWAMSEGFYRSRIDLREQVYVAGSGREFVLNALYNGHVVPELAFKSALLVHNKKCYNYSRIELLAERDRRYGLETFGFKLKDARDFDDADDDALPEYIPSEIDSSLPSPNRRYRQICNGFHF